MKPLCFINASKAVQDLLRQPAHSRQTNDVQSDDWELKFSTFRSDDYQFHDEFPHFTQEQYLNEESSEQLSYQLESDKESDGSEGQEKVEKSIGLCFRRFCFRNDREAIRRCLKAKVCKTKHLNFRNSHRSISDYFPKTHKFID